VTINIGNLSQLAKLFKHKTIIPIIGSGFNDHKFEGPQSCWHDLLKKVAQNLGIKHIDQKIFNHNCVASWEDLIRKLVLKKPGKG